MLSFFAKIIDTVKEQTGEDYYYIVYKMSFYDIIFSYLESEKFKELKQLQSIYEEKICEKRNYDEQDFHVIINSILRLGISPNEAFSDRDKNLN